MRGSAERSTKEVFENSTNAPIALPAFVIWHPDTEWEKDRPTGPWKQTGVAYVLAREKAELVKEHERSLDQSDEQCLWFMTYSSSHPTDF